MVKITLLGALLSLEWAIGIGTMLDSATSKNTRGNDFQPAKQRVGTRPFSWRIKGNQRKRGPQFNHVIHFTDMMRMAIQPLLFVLS